MIGIDVIEVNRIQKALKNDKFLSRIFTISELQYAKEYKDIASHLAGFFCAKESVMKALEYCEKISFLDIEICHNTTGKPFVKLTKNAKEIFDNSGYNNINISISQTKTIATAICILN